MQWVISAPPLILVPDLFMLGASLLAGIVVMTLTFRPITLMCDAMLFPMVTSRAHETLADEEGLAPHLTLQRVLWTVQNWMALGALYLAVALANAFVFSLARYGLAGKVAPRVFIYGALLGLLFAGLTRVSAHFYSTDLARLIVYDIALITALCGVVFVCLLGGADVDAASLAVVGSIQGPANAWIVAALVLLAFLAAGVTESLIYLLRRVRFFRMTSESHVADLLDASMRVRYVLGYRQTTDQIVQLLGNMDHPVASVRWIALTCPGNLCHAIASSFRRDNVPMTQHTLRVIAHESNRAYLESRFPSECLQFVGDRLAKRLFIVNREVAVEAFNSSMRAHDHFVPRTNISVFRNTSMDVVGLCMAFDDWWDVLKSAEQQRKA